MLLGVINRFSDIPRKEEGGVGYCRAAVEEDRVSGELVVFSDCRPLCTQH